MRLAANLAALALFAAASSSPASDMVELRPGTTVELVTAAEGARLLSVRDVFVKAMGPFDRSARLKTNGDVSEAEYLAFVAGETRDWTDGEKTELRRILAAFTEGTERLVLRLPPVITFVKTTGREEGHAAYCRGASVILPQKLLAGAPGTLADTVFHEIFHVYRTHNPDRRAALYAIVGFAPAAPIPLPESLARRKITNPDAPLIDSVIKIGLDGRRVPATPVLLSTTERYDTKKGGEFFDSMEFKLLVLEESGSGLRPALQPDGQPRLLDPGQTPDYLDQIGRNTRYIIHPEEILADNFVLIVQGKTDVPSPRILTELEAALTK